MSSSLKYLDLAAVTFPKRILLHGYTSVGKTSLMRWMLLNCHDAPRVIHIDEDQAKKHSNNHPDNLREFVKLQQGQDQVKQALFRAALLQHLPVSDLRTLVCTYALCPWTYSNLVHIQHARHRLLERRWSSGWCLHLVPRVSTTSPTPWWIAVPGL